MVVARHVVFTVSVLRSRNAFAATAFGHLSIEETIDDPNVFEHSFTIELGAQYVPDADLLEYVCAENEKSRERMIGTASEETARQQRQRVVVVSPDLVKKYAGVYDLRFPESPTVPFPIEFVARGDGLFMGPIPLIPMGNNLFESPLARTEFVSDTDCNVTHILMQMVEGDLKATRISKATP